MRDFIKANLGYTDSDDLLDLIEQAVKHKGNPNNYVTIRIGTEPEEGIYFAIQMEREYEDEGECSMSDILCSGYGETLYEAVENMIDYEVL
jgi:hypothetical protein